jgi:hypothetical protein
MQLHARKLHTMHQKQSKGYPEGVMRIDVSRGHGRSFSMHASPQLWMPMGWIQYE